MQHKILQENCKWLHKRRSWNEKRSTKNTIRQWENTEPTICIPTQSPWRALTLTLSLFSLLHLNRLKRLHTIWKYPNRGARLLTSRQLYFKIQKSRPLNWLQHRPYIGIEWPLEREIPFYPVAIGFLNQTLEEGLEGVRMESAMIRTTQLNWVWFTTVISLDHYILLVLSPLLLYSKNS